MKWNVYKMFKNGKRAKAPLTTFEYDDTENVYEYFESEIKKNFNEKNRGLKFMLLHDNEVQERAEEKTNHMAEETRKKQTIILGRFLKELNVKTKYKVVGGLIFAKPTHWKWQWCALECGTNNYIAGLSPRFDNANEADKWMHQQVQNLK